MTAERDHEAGAVSQAGEPLAELEDLLTRHGADAPPRDGEAAATGGAAESSPAPGADLSALLAELEGEASAAGGEAEPGLEGGEQDEDREPSQLYILFSLAGGKHAAAIDCLRGVGRVPAHTAVPNVPRWVRGVANFRGEILSLVDLGDFLGLGKAPSLDSARLLVAQAGAGEMLSGLVVERIEGETSVGASEIQPPASSTPAAIAPYLAGVLRRAGDVRAVLDLEGLLLSPAFQLATGA